MFLPAFFDISEVPITLWLLGIPPLVTTAFWVIGILRQRPRVQEPPSPMPHASIIVVGRNEEGHIFDCLSALCAQDYPADRLQIIYIDDHSTDQTLEYASRVAKHARDRLMVDSAPDCPAHIGPKKNALRYGISLARGELLLLTDADCVVSPAWAKTLARAFDPGTGAVLGTMLPRKRSRPLDSLYFIERILVSFTTAAAVGWGSPASACGGSLAYRRQALDEAGGIAFGNAIAGDDDLTVQAVARCGWHIRYAMESDATALELRRQHVSARASAAARHQSVLPKYPRHWRVAYAATIAAILCALALVLIAILDPQMRTAAFALLLPALIMFLSGIAWFARKLAVKPAGVLPLLLFAAPVIALVRPLFALLPAYHWRDRRHRAAVLKKA